MNQREEDTSMVVYQSSNPDDYRLMNGPSLQPFGGLLEIRLFYVRISPCSETRVSDHLMLRHRCRETGAYLEINGSRVPASTAASIKLRQDRLDKDSSEVTYVSTDNVRVTGAVEFEVHEEENVMVLCGSLERIEANWSNGNVALENGSKTGWNMDCYTSANGKSAFFRPKLGISSPSIEVYIAGCCSGVPVILTKTILISPRMKVSRHGMLDAIPQDEEIRKEPRNGLIPLKIKITEADVDDYESDGKIGHSYYSEDMCPGEEGELSLFNAGMRVGVGIGLGMCLGVGIGVGVLMRSYQATTRSFRRWFF